MPPIDPAILEMETAFRIKKNPLSQMRIVQSDDEEEEPEINREIMGIPSSPLGRMNLQDSDGDEEGERMDVDLVSSPPRSVATIDSFEGRNQDFIAFE